MDIYKGLTVLFWILLIFLPSVLDFDFTISNLKESAVLSCNKECSGLVKWIMIHKKRTVAWCNQTSCHSERGYKMSHDEYLKGNLSLTITESDYSKRTLYRCMCNDQNICNVNLRIKPVAHTLQIERGGSFIMDVPIPESVTVTFKRIDDASQSSVTLYEISERKIQSHPKYENQLSSTLVLKDLTDSNSGLYTIRDTVNDETIATYNLTVIETQNNTDVNSTAPPKPCEGCRSWMLQYEALGVGFTAGLILGILLGFLVVPRILRLCCSLWNKAKCRGSYHSTAQSPPHEENQLTIKTPP
ncbi:uncharacterized protein LOC134335391 [Trichomycterus rosablanca]|uniref:uncharacterized protein LOC134335391 n=1 Tax=Trichomycterus rosablanca TaxID=2290929 RepID=UPI002F35861D